MMGVLARLLLCLGVLWPLALPADDHVFVFHAGNTATVYRAGSLALVGTPEVGPGAVAAIGVPNPEQLQSLLKVYVLCSDTVVELSPNPPFAVRDTFSLQAAIDLGERSAL